MKIENKGIEITELPGVARLVVEKDAGSEHGVRLVLHMAPSNFTSHRFGLDEMRELIAGLQAAVIEAERMAGVPSTGGTVYWETIQDVPADVVTLLDRVGDRVYRIRNSGGWTFSFQSDEAASLDTLNDWAPFRRA